MAETENEKKREMDEGSRRSRFTFLVFLACLLSAGSLAYSTWTFLDLNQIDGGEVVIKGMTVSVIGLSAAAFMDLFWSATMVAEYRGRQIRYVRRSGERKGEVINILPYLGWLEVLLIAAMLGYHGSTLGGGAAVFTAILPIGTKFTWLMAIDDLRDPTAPTEEEKQEIADTRRAANVKLGKIQAMEKAHEAEMEERRREGERLLEAERMKAERERLTKQAEFDLKKLEMTSANELEVLNNELRASLQMAQLEARDQIEAMQDERAWQMGLRRRTHTITGHVVRQSGLPQGSTMEITDGGNQDQDTLAKLAELAAQGLTPPEQAKAQLARAYYEVDAEHGGTVTKTAFAKANHKHLPRVSEATTTYPPEWFIERGLATWLA